MPQTIKTVKGMSRHRTQGDEPLAIVGIGLRFPGDAHDVPSFWSLLQSGTDAIGEIPEDRWSITSFYDPRPNMPGQSHSKWGGFIKENDRFDAAFFSVSPQEAESMDPQQRLLLETAWHAFEDSGAPPERAAAANVGVFVGISYNEYARFAVSPVDHVYAVNQGSGAFDATGTAMSVAANRISHAFNFKGPSMAIDTACSSSLVAFNGACRAVWDGECDSALVAGVNHIIDPSTWIAFCNLGALSPDGRCKAFDASANGFVRGEGVGAVVVKPLKAALRDNNRIYACVRATAVNQDGYTPAMVMPNRESQERLILHTCELAGVTADQIDFVEAHGTGTGVGDPIEANALGNALGAAHSADHPLYIGSVKTNIGHLESAAGIAGLIKAALCLHYRHLPPSLHFADPNPAVDFKALNLHVVIENLDLSPRNGDTLRASVNSFGFGGANAHAILESAPRSTPPAAVVAPVGGLSGRAVLTVSARSAASLAKLASTYAHEIGAHPERLSDLAAAAAEHRSHLKERLTVVADSPATMVKALQHVVDPEEDAEPYPGLYVGGTEIASDTRPVLVFSGQGSQWAGMGHELYDSSPLFRESFDRCHDALRTISRGRLRLRDEVFATGKRSRLSHTAIAQPAIFAIQVSLAKLWQAWGIRPAAVVGHSVGEVAAAYVGGALSFDDAIRVIYHRGSKMATARAGRMLAAELTPEQALEVIGRNGGGLSLAACNGPGSVSISGAPAAVKHLFETLQEQQVFCRFVPVDYAFHSDLMDPVRSRLVASLRGISPRRSRIPIYSAITGRKLPGTRFDANYWWRSVRDTVQFSAAVEQLAADGHEVFIEINAHPVLQPALVQCLRHAKVETASRVFPSLRRDTPERDVLLGSLAQLHNVGLEINWLAVTGSASQPVDLPLYPFERQRFWRETPAWRSARLTPRPHPYLHVDIPSSRCEWMFFPSRREHPYLNDHVVSDRIVFPATGYIEMALAVARSHYDTTRLIHEDVEFQRVLFIPRDGPAAVLRAEFEPEKGHFRILSTSDEKRQTWTLHALGRIRPQERREGAIPTDPDLIENARRRCPSTTEIPKLYRLLEDSGLRYGPLFRGLTEAAFSETEGWSRIEIPEAIRADADGFLLHPVLLDSAFHVMALLPNKTPGTFLPVELRRLRVYQTDVKSAWCHTRLVRSTPSMYETDITLIDDTGGLIAVLEGFRLLAVESARTDHIPDVTFDFLQEEWIDSPAAADPTDTAWSAPECPASTRLTTLVRGEGASHTRALDRLHANTPLFSAAAQSALVSLGFDRKAGETFSLDHLVATLAIPARCTPRLLRLLHILEQDRTIRALSTPHTWKTARRLDGKRYATLWRRALEHAPSLSTELILLNLTVSHLPEILRGKLTAAALLGQEANSHLLAQFFGESAWIQPAHVAMTRVLESLIHGLPQGRTLSIVEIEGAGRQTAAHVLSHLPTDKITYLLTDPDPARLAEATDPLHPYAHLSQQTFDPGHPLTSQAVPPGSADVVLWVQPRKLTQSGLRRIRQILRPGGVVITADAKARSPFFDLAGVEHAMSPAITTGERVVLLKRCGFERVAHGATESSLGHRFFFGVKSRNPTSDLARVAPIAKGTRSGSWIIFSDPSSSVASRVAARLRSMGRAVRIIEPQDFPKNRDQSVAWLSSITRSPQGIVYLGALDAALPDNASLRDLRALQETVAHQPLFVAQALDACSAQHPRTALWIATSGTQRIPDVPGTINPVQAQLAGLTRVMHSELRSHPVRHVDFSTRVTEPELDGFCRDLVAGSDETEFAYRGDARLVPRLRTCPPHAQRRAPRVPLHETAAQLITRQAGVFDHLTLQDIERDPPGKGEIEVEIHAAGLNFRDVMKALGVYPTDAQDAGMFGDDFAGIVTTVGAGVKSLKPGERVVGVRPGCFRTHLTVPAALVFPLPDRLSFEEAATIPSTFLTAWYALHEVGRMRKGERVLIHAGAGGVGLAAIRLAQQAGVDVFATAGSPLKRDVLRKLGVSHVGDSRALDFADDILDATNGEGVDIVLNSLSGQAIPKSLECLREGGRFLELGKRDIHENSEIGLRPFKNCLTYVAIDLSRQISPARFKTLVARVRRLIDRDIIRPLPHTVFPISRAQDAFRHMAQGKHLGKVVFNFDNQSAAPEPRLNRTPASFLADATYLITGGTRGFGLEVARFLAQRGARHLVLASRSGTGASESVEILDAIRGLGATVACRACDVSSRAALGALLEEIRSTMPPLRGVFHGAMVMKDEVLARLTPDQFDEVTGPKVLGAWNLHRHTKNDPLDHFVLFSSISVLVGNPGQGSYVAANRFLDALAAHRMHIGQPGLSIAWDRLNEAGYAARTDGLAEHFDRMGWKGLDNREALRGLDLLLQNRATHMGVSNVDWSRWTAAAGLSAQIPRYEDLVSADMGGATEASTWRTGYASSFSPPLPSSGSS